MKLSIVIVTYNSEKHIFDCLDSVFRYNDIGNDLEVIIVDNKSTDFEITRKQLLDKYDEKIRIIENNKNGGYGQGNNVGIIASASPIILIMNPDVRLIEPVFSKVINYFEDSNIALLGFQQLDKDYKRGYSLGVSSIVHPFISLPLMNICNKFKLYISKYMYVAGACFFLRKSTFQKVGLFDENIFMYKEEDDIHFRLTRYAGAKIEYDSKIKYVHLHGLYAEQKDVNDCSEEKMRLRNSIYINASRGISENQVIKREIIYNRMRLLNAIISYALGKTTSKRNHISHLRAWLTELNEISSNNLI